MDRLPKDDGFILYPNHQGMFDVLDDSVSAAWSRPGDRIVLKRSCMNISDFEAGVCVPWGLCA